MGIEKPAFIKHYLEELYDIPFEVSEKKNNQDPWYYIKPHNEEKELFGIDIHFKNEIRLIIEVTPEKYAAFSIKDMESASIEKKRMFAAYAARLNERRAKTDFYINEIPMDLLNPTTWPDHWNSYRLRVSKSPIYAEDEQLDEAEIVSSWGAVVTGMFLSLLDVTTIDSGPHYEGGVKRVEQNHYERNPVNRELCLAANGYTCKICGFDFEKCYGKLGHHYIHVHHIVPVSKKDVAYLIDPVKDLIPVCPNCHAMLHREDPPLLPEQLRDVWRKHAKENN